MNNGQNQINLNIYFDENRLAQLKELVSKNTENKAISLSLKPPKKIEKMQNTFKWNNAFKLKINFEDIFLY